MSPARFSGFGPGKRGPWTRRSYDLSTGETRDNAPRRARTSSTRSGKGVRFQPFVSHQFTKEEAKQYGMRHEKGKTYVETEGQLNNWLGGERSNGRDVGWKDMDYREHGAEAR